MLLSQNFVSLLLLTLIYQQARMAQLVAHGFVESAIQVQTPVRDNLF